MGWNNKKESRSKPNGLGIRNELFLNWTGRGRTSALAAKTSRAEPVFLPSLFKICSAGACFYLCSLNRAMAANRDERDHDVSDEEIGFSSEEEKGIERELADIPFEELQRARSDGSHTARPGRGTNVKLGRANKNRPSELSSKLPVGRFREVIQAPKKVVRDPRFESLCGKLDPEGFRKRYNFLYDVELPAEKEKLQKLIKKSKDANVIEELKNHISWIDKQLKSAPRRTAESGIISEHVKNEREAAKQGKRPYYLKKSEIRQRKLVQKFDDLKAQGKLDSFIEKRRRKNASKDHRFIPYRRPAEGVQD